MRVILWDFGVELGEFGVNLESFYRILGGIWGEFWSLRLVLGDLREIGGWFY